MTQQTPSEKLTSSPLDGKVITDTDGKCFTLRQPDILDQYDFNKALGDDADSQSLLSMMMPLLFIAKMDNQVFETPRVYAECRVALRRVGKAGVIAIVNALKEAGEIQDQEEVKSEIKK